MYIVANQECHILLKACSCYTQKNLNRDSLWQQNIKQSILKPNTVMSKMASGKTSWQKKKIGGALFNTFIIEF